MPSSRETAGVRLEAIEAFQAGRDEDLTPEEREFAIYVRQVADLAVMDEMWDKMERRFGERGVVELTIFIALLNLILTLQSALNLPEMSDAEVQQVIREFREGKRPIPEFVDRSALPVTAT